MDLHPLETLAAATALTDTLATHGTPLSLHQSGLVTLALIYSAGTGGTGAEYVFDVSLEDVATNWVPLEEILDTSGTAASGSLVVPSSRLVRQILTASPSRAHVFSSLGGARWLRVLARETGTIVAAGTFTVQARTRIQ